ncbi:hypothetical protein E8E14_001368 [Neopestalotiopsis sp. 37M]|nr:hypothetical protein E8E14_001368 [Neopestalotiopsis sp. 37M]
MTLPATYYPHPPVAQDCDPSPGDPQSYSSFPPNTSHNYNSFSPSASQNYNSLPSSAPLGINQIPVAQPETLSPALSQSSSQIPAFASTQTLATFTVALKHREQCKHLCQELGIGTIINDIRVSHYGCKMSLSLGPQMIDPAGLLLGRLGNFQNAKHFTFIFTVTLHDAFRLWNSIFAINSGAVGAEARGTTVAAAETSEEDALA